MFRWDNEHAKIVAFAIVEMGLFMKSRLPTVIAVSMSSVVLALIAFWIGYNSHSTAQAAAAPTQFPLLAQAFDDLQHNFVRQPPADPVLEYGAIRGMVAALNDKYSFFIEPPVAQSESNVLAGHYGGIGVQLQRDEAGNFVLYPFPDSPAAKAGVQNGDVLLSIKDKDVSPTTQQDAVDQMLRGEVKDNSGVTFTVRHQPNGTQQTYTVLFQDVNVPSVVWRVLLQDSTLGYAQILRFTNQTPTELKNAIADLTSKAVKGLVLDLRNDPGGLLDESLQVAGQFLDGGVVFYEESRAGETAHNAATGHATTLPLIVLVNGGTASAAELVAGAIHDRGRGMLVGQQTYGKGSVQVILELADHSSIHVTTAEWLPPSRTALNGKGLTPDVPMIPDQNGRDVELGEAIRRLQASMAAPVKPTAAP